jgi:hypothetical protein
MDSGGTWRLLVYRQFGSLMATFVKYSRKPCGVKYVCVNEN